MSMENFLSRSNYPFFTNLAAALTMGVHLFLSVLNVLPKASIEFPHMAAPCYPDCSLNGPAWSCWVLSNYIRAQKFKTTYVKQVLHKQNQFALNIFILIAFDNSAGPLKKPEHEYSVSPIPLSTILNFGERHGPFLCYGRIKAKQRRQRFNVTNINLKAGPPNRQIGLRLTSSFFSLSK